MRQIVAVGLEALQVTYLPDTVEEGTTDASAIPEVEISWFWQPIGMQD